MKTLSLIVLLFISFQANSGQGIYLAVGGSPIYASSNSTEKSSMTGVGVFVNAGMRLNSFGFEFIAKQLTINNASIGNSGYESEMSDLIFGGGVRLFASDIFSLKAGLVSHQVNMDISKNGSREVSLEDDGTYFGVYVGMGIISKQSAQLDFYLESSLYPLSDIDMYLVDVDAGVRLYF